MNLWLAMWLAQVAHAEPWALREWLPVQVKDPIGSGWRTPVTAAEWWVDWQQEILDWTAAHTGPAAAP